MQTIDFDERAVHGDQLTCAGEPRGELVALQLALAAAGVVDADDLIDLDADRDERARIAAIYRRTQQLIAQHGARWAAALALPPGVSARHARGAFEAITAGGDVDLAAIVARTGSPIADLSLLAGQLSTVPAMPALRALALGNVAWRVDDVARITEGARLRRLALPYASVDPGPLVEVAQLPAMRDLARLDLSGTPRLSIPALVRALGTLPPTVTVALRRSRVDDARLREILDRVPAICGLDVRDNPLSIHSLRALVALPALRRLGFDPDREVVIDKRAVGTAIAKATAPLRWLGLGGAVNGKGLAAIADAPIAAELRGLDLANSRPGDIDAVGVQALTRLPALAVLVGRRDVADVGAAAIAGALPGLAHVDLGVVWPRVLHAPLAAYFGASIQPYRELEPGGNDVRSRRIEVPDTPGCTEKQFLEHLANLRGVTVQLGTYGGVLRDPTGAADPMRVQMAKLPNKPRYITLTYWRHDELAWAARVEAIVLRLADLVHGTDLGAEA